MVTCVVAVMLHGRSRLSLGKCAIVYYFGFGTCQTEGHCVVFNVQRPFMGNYFTIVKFCRLAGL